MVATAFRDGLAAARAGGVRAYAIAVVGYAPAVATDFTPLLPLVVAAMVLQVVLSFALIRVLGARRPEPVPPPPQVDDEGRRALRPERPGPPLTGDDARVRVAVRNAFALVRPAVTLTALILLAQVAAILTVVALSGGKVVDYSQNVLLLTALPVSSVFLTFLTLAPQRIALEGDPRVLVAVAHSVRIARTAYPLLLLLTVAEPIVTAVGSQLVPDKHPPLGVAVGVGSATVLLAAFLQVVTTAIANEVYLRGPRLELPVEAG